MGLNSTSSPFSLTILAIDSSAAFNFSLQILTNFIALLNSSIALSNGTFPFSKLLTILSNFSKLSEVWCGIIRGGAAVCFGRSPQTFLDGFPFQTALGQDVEDVLDVLSAPI